MKILAIVLFGLMYILLLSFPKIRHYVALSTAFIFLILGILPFTDIMSTIDFNVLLMIAGTMGVVSLFIDSKMPSLLADHLIERTPSVKWAIISLAVFAGIISAFIDNVATVLMIAPVALNISRKLKISPVPSIIAIAISSNLQGAATLVGDTTSILLGGYANMDFLDFFVFQGRLGLFFVVQAGAIAATLILFLIFRQYNQAIETSERTEVKDYFPTILLLGIVVSLILASFIPDKPKITNGIICVSILMIGLIRNYILTKDVTSVTKALKEIDFTTILLLTGLFIVIGGLTQVGVVDELSNVFVRLSGDNLFLIFTLIVWASVLFSAIIDNIPYVFAMLPVTEGIAELLGVEPYILFFGLLTGATLGGNLTPIGASANITAIGILRKAGHEVKTSEFMKLGIPFTLTAVTVGYALIWFIWR